MVERVSKLTKPEKVSRKTAEEVKDALVNRLRPVQKFVMTLAADNGKEFAYHEQVSQLLETSFYFATPLSFVGERAERAYEWTRSTIPP